MPEIKLCDDVSVSGAWRRVIAPGGSQVWRISGMDERAGEAFSIAFFDGRWADAEYQRRYRSFLAAPTRQRPPAPSEFRAVELQAGDRLELFRAAPDAFEASREAMSVRIGSHRLIPDGDDYRVTGPKVDLRLIRDGVGWRVGGRLLDRPLIDGHATISEMYFLGPPPASSKPPSSDT